jgi:hypothetical protein
VKERREIILKSPESSGHNLEILGSCKADSSTLLESALADLSNSPELFGIFGAFRKLPVASVPRPDLQQLKVLLVECFLSDLINCGFQQSQLKSFCRLCQTVISNSISNPTK